MSTHRGDSASHEISALVKGIPVVVTQRDGRALSRREPGKCAGDVNACSPAEVIDPGGHVDEVVAAQLTAEPTEQKKPPTVQALVDAYPNHPGGQSTTVGRSGPSFPRFPKGLLHGVFGLTVVDQDGQRDPEQSRRAVACERFEGGLTRDGGLSRMSSHADDHDNKDGGRAVSDDNRRPAAQ
jgi:hypothetical protein